MPTDRPAKADARASAARRGYGHRRDVQRVAGFIREQLAELERHGIDPEAIDGALLAVVIRRLDDRAGREKTRDWVLEVWRQLADGIDNP
jgi:hypothetical protein